MTDTIPLLLLTGASIAGLAYVLARAARVPAMPEDSALYRRRDEPLSCLPKR